MTIFPRKRQAQRVKRALQACGMPDEVAFAAVARLSAADMLDGRHLLEQYGEKILLEAIASAPLHRVGDHYYSTQRN